MCANPEPPQAPPLSVDFGHGPLRPSPDGRFLIHADGTPFFYLADTAWELLHRLTRDEVDRYLDNRLAKRFTVLQAVVLAEMNGLTRPNAYGDLPLVDLDPRRPNEPYFALVDYVVDAACDRGLYVGMVPTWGSYTVRENHPLFEDHAIFDPDNAHDYGRALGERYCDRPNVIWILGGDRIPEGPARETWTRMARGIAEGVCGFEDYTQTAMTYHPRGGHSSAEWWHDAPWLTFHMIQSGHSRSSTPHAMIAADYARAPARPVLNGEPGYEGIPDGLRAGCPKLDEHDVRRFAYWSVLAGACGHAYGANEMWMMWSPGIEPTNPVVNPLLDAQTPWHEAMDYPGAGQMRHLRALIESRPFLSRFPCQDVLASDPGEGLSHVRAAACREGSYAMLYVPEPDRTVQVAPGALRAERVAAWWYDPRDGTATPIDDDLPPAGNADFTTPPAGPDWVLVLDDASRAFPPPGTRPG
jgi:hypothetical protein